MRTSAGGVKIRLDRHLNHGQFGGVIMIRPIDLRAWNRAQIGEIQSPENRWYAGEECGHEPSPREAARHYVEHGGASAFAEQHRDDPAFLKPTPGQ